jgi:chitinase
VRAPEPSLIIILTQTQGSTNDGVNFTSLLKELKDAIAADGHEYIVTFTAPTSYWYLRHFDIGNMWKYVDWINLMSYDLHGVWDSDVR